MHNGASRANRLRTSASMRTAVFYGATLDSRSAATLAHRRRAVLAGRPFAVLAWLLYATLTGSRPCCAVDGGIDRSQAQVQRSTASAVSSRVDDDGRRRSPLRSSGGLSVTTHVSACGIAPTYGYFKFSPDRITVAPLQGRRDLITWRESIEPQLEVAGLKGFADGTVPIPPVDDVGLRGEFRATHLLTFMVISRCCSPVVQLVLRSCRERLDAGHQAWHFILSTYQVRDDQYIAQLEEKMTRIRMGEQESVTDYCNRARRILAEMRMAGAEYLKASYISHIIKGLPRGYNLMKRMMMVPGTRESLDEDSITSYILQDEAMQEAKQPTELLPQANYAAPTKLNQQQGQHRKPSGSGGRRRECWICHDPDHLSYECPDCDDSDEDDTKGGCNRSTSRLPPRDARPRKEKQTSRKTSSPKDVDNSSDKSRGNGETTRLMVGVVEPVVSLASEAGEDFQAVAAAVQANPMAVLLDSGCSHHLMGMKAVFVNMAPSDGVKHVRGFNEALQRVEGRRTANLLSAGQLKESGVQLKGDDDEMLLVAATGEVLSRARYNGRVLCTDLCPCSTRSPSTEVVALRTIILTMNSTPDRLHARLAHVSVDTIKSSAKHEVATGLDITSSTGADPPCVSCVGGKLAWHTFPDKGSDAEEALAVVHIYLCGPFRVAAKDGSLYFLLLKDRHTRFSTKKPPKSAGSEQLVEGSKQLIDDLTVDEEGELSAGEDSTDSDVVEVPITMPELRRTTRARRPPERLSFHACLPPAAFIAVYDEVNDNLLYDDTEKDEELPELDPDMHADPEHCWDIATITVKEALASWKGKAVKAAMEEEIHSLVGMGNWERVECPRGVNIMKNQWVLTTKYSLDDTVEREKPRLVVKGFTQVYGADYDETYSPESSYVTLRIFISIVAVLDLNLMQLNMKKAFL
ncbi:unnamed protein product [Closterium sp. NIES-53]